MDLALDRGKVGRVMDLRKRVSEIDIFRDNSRYEVALMMYARQEMYAAGWYLVTEDEEE